MNAKKIDDILKLMSTLLHASSKHDWNIEI